VAKNTISMKRFKANLTKISRLAKTGYNSITSVAKQIISTVTSIASKIAILDNNAAWQGASGNSLPEENYQSYYGAIQNAEERFLNTSLNNLMNYKDEIIHDIFTVGDALTHNADQIYFGIGDALRAEFNGLKDEFFSYGKAGGASFGNGFKGAVSSCMEEVKKMVLASAEMVNSAISSGGEKTSSSSVTYSSPSYNFYSSKQTVSEQLNEARKVQAISAMRRP